METYLELRDGTVRKRNDMIQDGRFNLSIVEQKILLCLISRIDPRDTELRMTMFSIPEFCRVCGIEPESGRNYQRLKETIKRLADKSWWIQNPKDEKQVQLIRWISDVEIDQDKDGNIIGGKIKLRLSDHMRDYLLQLREKFTEYELIYTLRFKSKFSIRLYEFLVSIHYHDIEPYTNEFTLDRIRMIIGAEQYKTWQHLKDRALVPAVTEINSYSDKEVRFEPTKNGRRIVGIVLTVESKPAMERIKAHSDAEKALGTDQMTLWDILCEKGETCDG